jgi:hypothetical protein
MDIENFLSSYPSIDDDKFQEKIFLDETFYSLKTPSDPTSRALKGWGIEEKLFNHQKIVRRFLSSEAIYNECLIDHGMGTGKTCLAMAIAESVRHMLSPTSPIRYKPALVIVKNNILKTNFIDALVGKVCMDANYSTRKSAAEEAGKLEEINYEDLIADLEREDEEEEGQEVKRKERTVKKTEFTLDDDLAMGPPDKELYSHNYDIVNLRAFGNTLKTLIDKSQEDQLVNEFSNRIIIIDEIHNLRPQKAQKGRDDSSTYYEYYKTFLHIVQNCKIILLSGTPMVDRHTEIVPLMNLILPLNNQLDTKDLQTPDVFKRKVRGRISYVRSSGNFPRRIDMGVVRKPFVSTKVVYSPMSDYQYARYIAVRGQRKEGEDVDDDNAFSINIRLAATFVYPPGTDDVKSVLQSRDKTLLTTNLGTYSSKYATILRQLNDPAAQNKLAYVYSFFVAGGGSELFYNILLRNGFTPFKKGRKGKNQVAIIRDEMSISERKAVINTFRSPENSHGEYIRVLVGTSITGEGVDFKNIRQVHIVYPHWNYSVLEQAVTRAIREKSHWDLPESERDVEVYFHAADKPVSRPTDEDTLDTKMYYLAESKAKDIGKVTRLIQESAIDCGLNYGRNVLPGDVDGSRECQYMKCVYKCDTLDRFANTLPDGSVEYSAKPELRNFENWNLLYAQGEVEEIMDKLVMYFTVKQRATLGEIMVEFEKVYPQRQNILEALLQLTTGKYTIYNSFGTPCTLVESNNVFYLQPFYLKDDKHTTLSAFYGQKLFMTDDYSFEKGVNNFIASAKADELSVLVSKALTKVQAQVFIEKEMNYTSKLSLLENTLAAEFENSLPQTASIQNLQAAVLDHFKPYVDIANKKHTYYSVYGKPEDRNSVIERVYVDKIHEWVYGDKLAAGEAKRPKEKERKQIKETKDIKPTEKVIGTVDGKDVFRIVNRFDYPITGAELKTKKVAKGLVATSWKIPELLRLMSLIPINIVDAKYADIIDADLVFPGGVDRDSTTAMRTYLTESGDDKYTGLKSVVETTNHSDLVKRELQLYVYSIYNSDDITKQKLIQIIRRYLEDNDLIVTID